MRPTQEQIQESRQFKDAVGPTSFHCNVKKSSNRNASNGEVETEQSFQIRDTSRSSAASPNSFARDSAEAVDSDVSGRGSTQPWHQVNRSGKHNRHIEKRTQRPNPHLRDLPMHQSVNAIRPAAQITRRHTLTDPQHARSDYSRRTNSFEHAEPLTNGELKNKNGPVSLGVVNEQEVSHNGVEVLGKPPQPNGQAAFSTRMPTSGITGEHNQIYYQRGGLSSTFPRGYRAAHRAGQISPSNNRHPVYHSYMDDGWNRSTLQSGRRRPTYFSDQPRRNFPQMHHSGMHKYTTGPNYPARGHPNNGQLGNRFYRDSGNNTRASVIETTNGPTSESATSVPLVTGENSTPVSSENAGVKKPLSWADTVAGSTTCSTSTISNGPSANSTNDVQLLEFMLSQWRLFRQPNSSFH